MTSIDLRSPESTPNDLEGPQMTSNDPEVKRVKSTNKLKGGANIEFIVEFLDEIFHIINL